MLAKMSSLSSGDNINVYATDTNVEQEYNDNVQDRIQREWHKGLVATSNHNPVTCAHSIKPLIASASQPRSPHTRPPHCKAHTLTSIKNPPYPHRHSSSTGSHNGHHTHPLRNCGIEHAIPTRIATGSGDGAHCEPECERAACCSNLHRAAPLGVATAIEWHNSRKLNAGSTRACLICGHICNCCEDANPTSSSQDNG